MKKWTRFMKKASFLLLSLILGLFLLNGCTSENANDVIDLVDAVIDVMDDLETSADQDDSLASLEQAFGETTSQADTELDTGLTIEEDGWYSTRDEVALYIHTYGHLPGNYITKNEANDLGWNSSDGNLWDVAEGMSIGGDKFGNREGLLPKASGRQYYECDINYAGGYRGAERIIYSNDGLIYYTNDHYESFTCLYGEE